MSRKGHISAIRYAREDNAIRSGVNMVEREMLLERLARVNGVTVEDMRKKIAARISAGMDDPDPERRAQWEHIPHAGELPTPEEWLEYVVKRLYAEEHEGLLRRYIEIS